MKNKNKFQSRLFVILFISIITLSFVTHYLQQYFSDTVYSVAKRVVPEKITCAGSAQAFAYTLCSRPKNQGETVYGYRWNQLPGLEGAFITYQEYIEELSKIKFNRHTTPIPTKLVKGYIMYEYVGEKASLFILEKDGHIYDTVAVFDKKWLQIVKPSDIFRITIDRLK